MTEKSNPPRYIFPAEGTVTVAYVVLDVLEYALDGLVAEPDPAVNELGISV